MKKLLSILILGAALATVNAQGTFQFTAYLNGASEVPPNNSTATGTAQLTLTGNTLDVFVDQPWMNIDPISAAIHGPAAAGATASIIFDLGTRIERPPFPPYDLGGYEFVNNGINLSDSQVADLMAGLWYIDVTSVAFPNGELRGQIQLVPEPSTVTLLGFGMLISLGSILRRAVR